MEAGAQRCRLMSGGSVGRRRRPGEEGALGTQPVLISGETTRSSICLDGLSRVTGQQ